MTSTAWFQPTAFVRVLSLFVLAIGLSSQFPQNSFAGTFTLVDDNSVANFDTDSQANAYSWQVDGRNQLYQQAFWYRIGNTAEQSLDTLPHAIEGTTDTNFDGNQDTLFVRYTGAGFRTEVRYTLDGGLPASRASDMAEQISISNLGTVPLNFHFFQYSDFDLNNSSNNDVAVFTNANAVVQSEGSFSIAETVITPVPSHREIDYFSTTLTNLNDLVATTLSDTPATGVVFGPGDVTWAYQWDFVLQPGATFQISKDKNLSGVPEPSAFALLGVAAVMIQCFRRKR